MWVGVSGREESSWGDGTREFQQDTCAVWLGVTSMGNVLCLHAYSRTHLTLF